MSDLVRIFLFVFGVIGMTHIIVDSSIMSSFRELFKKTFPPKIAAMIECYQCSGTWCGFLCGFMLFDFNIFVIFLSGCAGSFLSTLAASFLNFLEAKAVVDIDV